LTSIETLSNTKPATMKLLALVVLIGAFQTLNAAPSPSEEELIELVRRGLLDNVPVIGSFLEGLTDVPLLGPIAGNLLTGLGIMKREAEIREKREGILSNIPVAGTLIESLGEIPIAGRLLDGIFHALKIVREMEVPEGATPEEAHHYVKRQLCAEIPIIRKWCHAVAEIPLIGKPIEGLANALNIM